MAHISLHQVCVEFPIYNSVSRSLRNTLFKTVGGVVAAHNQTVTVKSLQDISLALQDGDRLGLIGHNGAGKTTLLRTLAGAYYPTSGSITHSGKRTALTDIGMGLNPELTGYANIVDKLVLMGYTYARAKSRIQDIEDFSELGEYLSLPLRTYSTGMYLRLAFAIVTSIVPDILILDEMIGTGDARFLEKIKNRTDDFLGQTKIMIIASHDAALIKRYCNKTLWLHQGSIKAYGATQDILERYASNSHTQT